LKPVLAFARPQRLARALFSMNALLLFERPRGLTVEPATLGGVPGAYVRLPGQAGAGVLFYVHGGAFVLGDLRSYRHLVARIAAKAGMTGYFVDYRLAPEHPFPAAVEDVVAAYRGLLASGMAADRVVLCGDSAGGALVMALLHLIPEAGLPMPRAAALICPVADLTGAGPSLVQNVTTDPLVPLRWIRRAVRDYLGAANPRDPRASPLFGHFVGACPVFLQVGRGEVLLDESLRLADVLRRDGVTVTVKVWEHVPHVWHLMSGRVPEADAAIDELAEFVRQRPIIEPPAPVGKSCY
jgi:epsilon-lactone hydrolase